LCFRISYKDWIVVTKYTSHCLRHFRINVLIAIDTIKSSTQCIYIVIFPFIFLNMQFFPIIIFYFCCLYELLLTSICKLSKFSNFIFYYKYYHYNIVHKYFPSLLFSFWDHLSIFNFHKTFLLNKWRKELCILML
jgi:hypothetical protein